MNLRAVAVGLLAAVAGGVALAMFPQLKFDVFARGAARLVGVLSGSAVSAVDDGWLVDAAGRPLLVSVACSATDYFLLVTALLGGRFAAQGRGVVRAVAGGCVMAVPVTIFINALRILGVAQAHRWIIPRFPPSYGPFLHMLAGAAVFLPALIGLSVCLELYGRTRVTSRS